jgi:pyruvate formate lyase activating enzyme
MEGLQADPGMIGRRASVKSVLDVVLQDLVFYDESGGGMTLSGGEPLQQPAFAAALLAGAHQAGIRTAVDTSGAVPWSAIEQVIPFTDLFLFDIKVLDGAEHRTWVGPHHELNQDNFLRLAQSGARVRMRIPLIPGITDTDHNMRAAAVLAMQCPSLEGVDLLPYNPAGEHKYRRMGLELRSGHHMPHDHVALMRASAFFEGLAVPVSIGGSP